MTAKQGLIADWEVPAGGLAEEVAAPQPPREERTSIDDVEFFFLMDDEPKIAIHQEQQEETPPPTDFLFPFDQQFGRAPSVSAGSFLEGDIAAAPVAETHGSPIPDSANDQDLPDSTFPLTRLLEREQLEEEIGKLRGELERHRATLTEMREGHSSLLPTPITRRSSNGSYLPAAADVLSGLTTVGDDFDGRVDYRDSEEFRANLPKARALLGFGEADDDATLLQIIMGEQPNFQALAPVGRRLPMIACEDFNATPRLVSSEAPIHDVELPVERTTNEIVLPVRWWNAIPAVLAFAAVAAGLTAFGIGSIGQVEARTTLRDALRGSPMRAAEVEAVLSEVDGTFLSRFDGRFDYLLARLQDYASAKQNAKELLSSRRVVDPRVVKFVDRAIERSPGIGWHRLSRAALATSSKSMDAEDFWKAADSGRIDDPLYWEILGDHYRMTGRRDEALAMFANALRRKPNAARDVLSMLSEVRIDLKASLAVIPPHPVAALQAVKFVKNEEGRRDWREHAETLLQRLGAPPAGEDGDDLAARGQLQLMLGKLDDAAASFEFALSREPDRNDFRLELAKLRYEQKRFDESGRLAERIVHSEPASGLGEEARVLRNRIELVTSGRRSGAGQAAN